MTWLDYLSWTVNAFTAVIVVLNVWAVRRFRKRMYRAGWLDGRIDLLQHMERAHQEGLNFETFIRQVAARDGFPLPGDLDQDQP